MIVHRYRIIDVLYTLNEYESNCLDLKIGRRIFWLVINLFNCENFNPKFENQEEGNLFR